jgi:hypothetical protein
MAMVTQCIATEAAKRVTAPSKAAFWFDHRDLGN